MVDLTQTIENGRHCEFHCVDEETSQVLGSFSAFFIPTDNFAEEFPCFLLDKIHVHFPNKYPVKYTETYLGDSNDHDTLGKSHYTVYLRSTPVDLHKFKSLNYSPWLL